MATFEQLVQKVVDASQRHARGATVGQLAIGQATHRAIRAKVGSLLDGKTRRAARAEVLDTITARLAAEGCGRVNLNRAVQVAGVASVFGLDDCKKLPLHAVVAFGKLVRRDALKEEWQAKAKHQDAARALWAQVVKGDVGPGLVRHEIDKLLGVTPRAPKPKPSPVDKVVAVLAGASVDVIAGALTSLRDDDPATFRKVLLAVKPLATPKPKRAPEPPPTTEAPTLDETKRKGLFGRAA